MKPEILERTIERAGYVTVERMRIRLADGAQICREMERHGDSVAVLPYDPERRVALVARQFRAPVFAMTGEAVLEEACAGMIDGGGRCGRHRAEGGLRGAGRAAGRAGISGHHLAGAWCRRRTPDIVSRRLPRGRPRRRGGGLASEEEDILVVERPLGDLAADADAGRITDGKLFILVTALRLRHPALFG